MSTIRAQIVATIGPASADHQILGLMIAQGVDIVRLNFSWGDLKAHGAQIALIRELEKETRKKILIMIDLPGPRIQEKVGHSYHHDSQSALTEEDKDFIQFAINHHVDYIAVSFVGKPEDVLECRKIIKSFGGTQKIIAKIERAVALTMLDDIVAVTDAVMVARGDLGNEVPLEQIPFVQDRIIESSKRLHKPVIVATQMLLSMVESDTPTRAEVADVTTALLEGADAVMLSEESAKGHYPVQAVAMMAKITVEVSRHQDHFIPNHL
jgi:pyruvate kinase